MSVVSTYTFPDPNLTPAETWATGVRTPYGLAFSPTGELWEVEHGPRGAHLPALGGFGATMAVKDDAVERHGVQVADRAAAIPLREVLLYPASYRVVAQLRLRHFPSG